MDNLIEGIFANRQNPLLNLQAECFPKAQALAQAGLDYSWAFPWGVDPRMTPTVGAQVIDYAHKTLTSGQPFQLSGIVVNVFPSPQFKGCKVPVVVGNPLGLAVLPPDVNRAIGMLLAMGYAVVLDDTGRMAFPEAPSLPVEEG